MDSDQTISRLEHILHAAGRKVIACSGGIDSLLLATIAHRGAPAETLIAHASSPAVPADAAHRVREFSSREGWDTLDDLAEYRPGLEAAANHGVSHPFIEAKINKSDIRAICRHLGLPIADLPASPCLASRIYTGTRVTKDRVRAIDSAESAIRRVAQVDVVRCRVRENEMLIEVLDADRVKIDAGIIELARQAAQSVDNSIEGVKLYTEAYRSGRAFQGPK